MDDHKPKRRIRPLWSLLWLAWSVGLYGWRTDATFALSVWPAWIYVAVGLLLSVFARKYRAVLCVLWLGFAAVFVDETWSPIRLLKPATQGSIRVVSLNCAGGTLAAAEEAARLKPDILLLQESPSKDDLTDLARRLYGDQGQVISGPDASIVARGPLQPFAPPVSTGDFVAGEWLSPSGIKLKVVSLRLLPPVMRIDLFSPDAWREFASNRADRRSETTEIARKLKRMGVDADLIGGDFNTPPDPQVQKPLLDSRADSFAEAGVGYGATCVNPFPCLVRIDQIWHSSKLVARSARVVKTTNSDHRMLVTEFDFQ